MMAEASPSEKPNTNGERRIPVSGEGRLRYQTGDPHALDAQFAESRRLGQRLTDAAKALPPCWLR